MTTDSPRWEITQADDDTFHGRFVDATGTVVATTKPTAEKLLTTLAVELVLGHKIITGHDGFTWAPWSGDPTALIEVRDVTLAAAR